MRQNNGGQKKDMKVIGITGGVGCGKSAVLAYLESEYAAVVTELDEVAKNLQKSGQECFGQIVAQFGVEILGDDGELDRSRLAEIVFRRSGKTCKVKYDRASESKRMGAGGHCAEAKGRRRAVCDRGGASSDCGIRVDL